MKKQLVLLAVLLLCADLARAQFPPVCPNNTAPLAKTCAQACVLCDLDGYQSATTQSTQGQAPPGFCTQVVHSMGWIGFVAGSTDLSIEVSVGTCTQGSAIEMGIYQSDDCQNFELVSDCNTFMPQNGTYQFSNTVPLVPGCVYYLVFDNNGPAACPFTVQVTSGSAAAPVLPPPGPIEGFTKVCPGVTVTYTIPPVFGTCLYEWTAPPGALINGMAGNVLLSPNEGTSVTVKWGNTGGPICVRARNACNSSPYTCLPVVVENIPPTILPQAEICSGQSYEWLDGNFYAVTSLLSYTYQTPIGCDSIVRQQLVVLPPIKTFLGNILLCPGESFEVGGMNYNQNGAYTVMLTAANDCDSTVIFSILNISLDAEALAPDALGCSSDSVALVGLNAGPNTTYAWYGPTGVLLSQMPTALADTVGFHRFVVKKTVGSKTCTDTDTVQVLTCCTSSAGTMDTLPVQICGPKPFVVPHQADHSLGPHSRLWFLLFTDPADPMGSLVARSDTAIFPFDPGTTQWNTTYYAAAVAGDSLLYDSLPFPNACLSVSHWVRVRWSPKPEIWQPVTSNSVCQADCVDLMFAFSGEPPFEFQFLIQQNGQTLYGRTETSTGLQHSVLLCPRDFNPPGEAGIPMKVVVVYLADAVCGCGE